MPGDKIPIPQFAAKIKAKYPEYKDVNDTLLVQKIIAKYPEYKEQVEFEPVQIQEPVKKKEQTGGIGSVIGGQAGSSAGQSEKGLFSKLFDLATTPDKETYDPVSEATKPHREILAEAQGETKQLVPNLQRSDATAVKPYVDINTALKKANTIRDIEANAFPDISTAIQWKDKMDSGALSPKNRTTQLARKIVTDAENTVSALKNSGADYDKGAIEYAMSSNDAFGEAVRKMVKDGKPLDDFVKGEAAMRYLGSRFFRELPDDSPVKQGVIAAAKEAQQKYPSMYFRQLNEKISAKREEMGMNNWFYNEPGVSSSDKAMDALRKEGKISDGEEMAYVNAYRPMMQAGINPGIKTPGFVESTGGSISHQLKSAVGLLEDVGEATGASRLYSTVGGDIRRQLREQQQMIKEPNWSYGHQVSRAAGNLTGLIATMGGEGVALKGLGLGANATNAVATGLNFFHDIYKAEEQKHGKGDPMAYLSAITQTVLWSEGTKIFGNAFNDVIKSSKGEVNDILKSLQDGTIQNSDATQSIMNVLLNKITKGGKEAIKDVAKIKGIEVLNGTLSNLFNGQLDIKTPINDALHDTPTFFLSLLPVKVMGAKGKDMTKDYLSSLVKYPELAENITDPKAKQNYESLVKLEPFLNEQGLNNKQKDNYRLLYLKGKILEEQSGALPDKGLSGQLEKNIKENEIAKKAVVDPEMGNKKIVQEFYDNDLLDKGSKMMLENEEGKFSESKVGEYLKSIAQQENGLDENWKPLEGGGAKLKGRVPDTIIELANERWKKEIEAAKPEEASTGLSRGDETGLNEDANKILGLHDNGVNFDLFDNNKLRQIAKDNGIDLPEGAKNADIIKALKDKQAELAKSKTETTEDINTTDNTDTILEKAQKKGSPYAELIKVIKDKLGNVKTLFTDKLNDSQRAYFDGQDIQLNKNKKQTLQTWVHEAIHALTQKKLNDYDFDRMSAKPVMLSESEINAAENLHRIYKEIKSKTKDLEEHYGLHNIHEFISEAFANPEFQKYLKTFKGEGKSPNIFKQFLDAVAKMLGLKDPTILDDIFHHTEKLMDADKPKDQSLSPNIPKEGGGLSRGDEKNQSVTFVERIFGKAKDKKSKKEEGVVFKTKVQSKVSSDGEVITTKAIGEVEENGVVNNEISVSANNNWVDVNEFNSAIEPYIEKNPKLGYGSNDTWVKWNEMLSEDNPPAKVQFKELREPTEQNTNKRSFLEVKVQYENGETGNFLFEVKPKDQSLSPNIPKEGGEQGGSDVDVKKQIEEFGVPKEDIEATHGLLGQVFNGLKKAGITAAKTVGDWVGIGKGTEKPYSLKIDGKEVQVKNTSPDVVNGFYSPLEKTINETKFDKLPAKQWAEKFATGEEAKWTGLTEWLKQQTGTVSKADIQQFLKDNRIQVVEVVKSSENIGAVWNDKYEAWETTVDGKPIGDFADTKDEAIRYGKANFGDATKFGNYQLAGEKENYKEVLVTMPKLNALKEANLQDFKKQLVAKYGENFKGSQLTDTEIDKLQELKSDAVRADVKFKSSHFDEPNILVHLRMNTRTDAEGNKVLFLEEVQSDWGQKGKKEGFAISKEELASIDKQIEENRKKRVALNEEQYKIGSENKRYWEIDDEVKKLTKDADALMDKWSKGSQGTATAPFVTDTNAWTKLALKTALKEAVKQGADKIAWTTGEQQNERYSLEKQVDEILYFPTLKEGVWDVSASKNDRQIWGEHADAKRIEAMLGKDIANKITKGEGEFLDKGNRTREDKYPIKSLRGDNLKVGGSQMLDSYGSPELRSQRDQLVIKKVGDKYEVGGKIFPHIKEAEKFKENYGLGIVGNVAKSLFKQDPKTVEIESTNKTIKDYELDGIGDGFRMYEKSDYGTLKEIGVFKTREDAQNWINKNNTSTQHSIDITPEMRKQVESDGQPLFKEAEAQYRIESGKNIIEAIKDFDGSPRATVALTHEIMHPTVVSIIDGAKEGNEVGAKHTKTIVDEYNKATGKNITQEQLIEGNDKFKEGTTTKEYRNVQEFIAKAWERYHREGGKGFSEGFQKVLEQITQAFKAVYKSISGKELTPELKQMFDDILGKPQPTETKDTVTKEQVSNETIPEGTKGNESKPTVQEEETGNIPVEVSQSAEGGEPPKPPVEEGTTGMGEDGVSGIKKALVSDKIIEGVDLEKIGDKEMMALGRKIIETGEVKPDALVQKIITEKTGVLTPKEVVSLITYKADIDNGLRDAYKQLNEKKESGEDTGTLGVEIADLERQQNDFDVMAVITANQQSMAFRLRKMMLDRDYNVITQIEKYKKNNNGYIPAEVEAKFRDLDKQLKEVKEKLAEAEKRASDKEGQQAVENIKESVGREKKYTDEELEKKVQEGVQSEVNKIYEQLPVEKKSAADKAIAALERFQKKLRGKAYSDVAGFVAIIDAGVTTIKNAIKLGVSIEKAVELGINKIKEKLKGKKWDKEDEFRKDMIEGFESEGVSTKKVKDKPTINEDGSVSIPNEMLRNLVERGVTDINDLTKEVHKQVVKDLPNITERQVRDYITDYGKKINPTADEVQRQLNTAKRIGRLLSEVEDLQNKKAKEKNPSTLAKLTEKERELKRQIRALEKDAGIDHKRHLTEEEKISEAKERVKNRISELQRAIKNKDFAKKTKLPEPKDDELVRLEAQKQKLEEQYDIEQYRLKLKNRTFWQKAEDVALEATNGLVRGLVASVDLSAGLVQGTRRLFVDLFKSGYQLLTFQKLKPNRSLNAFGTMFKHLVSQKASDDYLAKVKASKLQPLIKASKLAVDDKSGKISIKEGFFISNWINVIWDKAVAPGLSMPISIFTKGNIRKGYDIAKKINPYLASQRAFDGYINSIRVNTFIDFAKRLEQQGYNFESNPEVFKSAADVVNTETGRGGLGAADASSRWLNIFLFAPRKVISEVKLYTPYAFAYYAKMPKVVRMESLKNLAVFMTSFVGANAMFWAANRKGDEDDDFWNPNSSNFLTHKVGNKRISLGGGAKSMIVFQSRLLTGKFTDQYGKTTELGDRFGKQINTRLDLVWRFILGKGSPAVGIISQKLDEKKGLEVDDKDIIKNLSIPIWMQDLKDMYKDDPTSVNAILTAFSIFGANVRTVDEPKSQDNTTSSKERKRPSRSERVKLRHEMK